MIELTSGVSESDCRGQWESLTYRGDSVDECLLGREPVDWMHSPAGKGVQHVKDYWGGDTLMNVVYVRLSGIAYDPDSECFILGYEVNPDGDHFNYATVVWSARDETILMTKTGPWGLCWAPNGLRQAREERPNLIHLRYFP